MPVAKINALISKEIQSLKIVLRLRLTVVGIFRLNQDLNQDSRSRAPVAR